MERPGWLGKRDAGELQRDRNEIARSVAEEHLEPEFAGQESTAIGKLLQSFCVR
jgi:hypothetical protein